MSYSEDLRLKVLSFVKKGGSKTEAVIIFGVSRWCVYDWLKRDNVKALKTGPKSHHKIDLTLLSNYISKSPDATITELSKEFLISRTGIWYCLKKLNITRKKTWFYAERCRQKRKSYLKKWYKHKSQGKTFVYLDESGFEVSATRQFGYAPQGKKVYGERSEFTRPRTSL